MLRDLYVRGKYRDVILPMTVLRRLDSLLEPSKPAVLEMKTTLDKAKIVHQNQALRQAAGQAFYNTSKFTLRDLKARASQQQLKADFEAYLDGFSPNVQDILEKFEFRNQIPRLSKADVLGTLIEKFLSADVNLSPHPVLHGDGSIKYPGLDNHGMGTIFEELVRRFNEENNEEAGEHWTPRDAVTLMAKLVFLPVADRIDSGTYLVYDGACGTGGMLPVAEETLTRITGQRGKQVTTHLYGQEINSETYAIAKADFLLKGEGEAADNIIGGPEHSTLSNDAFPSREFDFMLSNPSYGKSWKNDLERLGGKADIKDPRFLIEHGGDAEYSLITRSWSDTTLHEVVAAVAADHGLSLRMPPPPPTIHLPHLDQSNASDLHLLTRLARRWDYVFKMSGKRLAFVPAGQGLAASREPVTSVTIRRDQVKEYRAVLADRGRHRSVVAHWQDQEEGKRASERGGRGGGGGAGIRASPHLP